MNHLTEERVKIIGQYKYIFKGISRSPDKRIKILKSWGLMNYVLASVLLLFVIFISINTLLHLETFVQNWSRSGLLVIMTISLSLNAHFTFIEFLLLKHLKNLQQVDFIFEDHQNNELRDHVDNLNNRRFKPYWIIIPSLFIMLAAILEMLDVNPFWELFPLPVLIFSILLLYNLNHKIFLIWRDIKNIESNVLLTQS